MRIRLRRCAQKKESCPYLLYLLHRKTALAHDVNAICGFLGQGATECMRLDMRKISSTRCQVMKDVLDKILHNNETLLEPVKPIQSPVLSRSPYSPCFGFRLSVFTIPSLGPTQGWWPVRVSGRDDLYSIVGSRSVTEER